MAWTSTYNLHIHCVLHLNKNDNNTRGHIGTELENKAETVLVICKDKKNTNISEVRPMHMRDKEFSSFAFHIDENSLPVLEEGYHVTVVKVKVKDEPLTSLPESVHKVILDEIFKRVKPKSYKEIINILSDAYATNGYRRGTNAIKKMLKLFSDKGIIKRIGNEYIYTPLFSPTSDEV